MEFQIRITFLHRLKVLEGFSYFGIYLKCLFTVLEFEVFTLNLMPNKVLVYFHVPMITWTNNKIEEEQQ